jgi:hypothetical protein
MSTSESFRALRRANLRHEATFSESVENVAGAVRVQIATSTDVVADSRPPRRLVGASAAAAALAVAAAAAFLTIGSPGGGPGVENASAAVSSDLTDWLRRPGAQLMVVDGVLYGVDPGVEDGWIKMGSPSNIDADSGTTPAEYLAAVREDIGGITLRRFTRGMTGLTMTRLPDGSTVYRGTVPAGAIARETGFKEGQHIRVLPWGYVAHDEAENPKALLDTAVTVGPDGVVREIVVTWAPAWRYTVTYSDLGATEAPVAPANARDLLKERLQP